MPDTPANPTAKPVTLSFLHDPTEADIRLDFLEYWRTITKRKGAIISFALVITLLTAVVVFVMTPVYRATATVLIEREKQKVVSVDDVYSGFGSSREHFQTQVELIKSHGVALRTINKLRLYDKPEFDPRAPKKGVAALLESIGFFTAREPTVWNEETLSKAVLPAFTSHLSIEPIRLSQLVTISFESPNAELAAEVANTLANSYIQNDLDARYEMTHQASVWLQERVKSLKDNLNESENALQSYREKKGIADVKGASQSGAGEAVQQLTMQLITARARRAEAENAFKAIKGAQASGELSSLPAVLRSPMVADSKRQEAEADRKMSEVSQRYGKQHPKFVQAEGELATARDNVKRQVDMVVAGITQEYEAARGTERALEGTLASARGAIVSLNRQEFGLNVLERDADSNRQMYDMFIKRAKETNVAGDLQSTVGRVVDEAAVPGRPVKPNKPITISVALVLGSLIGMMIALMLDLLDNTLKRTEDVETRLKQPILTVLPLLSKEDLDRKVSGTQVLFSPNSIYSEAIRSARTGVLLSSVDLPKRILVVTSSVPGEGKTTFSANLALSHANTKKTLLIDADMRRPSLGKAFGLEPSAAGLSDLVAGSAKITDCLRVLKDTNLSYLPSGPVPPNPLELLHSESFKQTLGMLSKLFDIIIIDSPPVELVSDALVIASQATGVIFVTKAMSTPYPLARKAIRRIRRANGNIIGVVLNALDFKKAEKYYGEYSVYGKYGSYRKSGYGGGYGQTYGTPAAPSTTPPAKA
jgi:capsular exopolysaccharide synthesis family protein